MEPARNYQDPLRFADREGNGQMTSRYVLMTSVSYQHDVIGGPDAVKLRYAKFNGVSGFEEIYVPEHRGSFAVRYSVVAVNPILVSPELPYPGEHKSDQQD